jgi:hypothetical protein
VITDSTAVREVTTHAAAEPYTSQRRPPLKTTRA